MIDSIRSRVAFAVLTIGIAAVVVTLAVAYLPGSGRSTSTDHEESKGIITYRPIYNADNENIYAFSYARVQDIASNSAVRFLNPFGKSMSTLSQDPIDRLKEDEVTDIVRGADAFEQYILIRLPSQLGGNLQNVSAFRAYSILDPGSKCLLQYWPERGAILQDPCHSDIFRVSDGYSCFGRIVSVNPVLSSYNSIPKLKLSVDDQGYLLATRPDGQLSGDGTVGEGRIMLIEEIKAYEADTSCDISK